MGSEKRGVVMDVGRMFLTFKRLREALDAASELSTIAKPPLSIVLDNTRIDVLPYEVAKERLVKRQTSKDWKPIIRSDREAVSQTLGYCIAIGGIGEDSSGASEYRFAVILGATDCDRVTSVQVSTRSRARSVPKGEAVRDVDAHAAKVQGSKEATIRAVSLGLFEQSVDGKADRRA